MTDIKDENAQLKQRLLDLQDEFHYTQDQANHLTDELARQQTLYSELKKMRGRGDEIDQIQEYKQVRGKPREKKFGTVAQAINGK